MNEKEMHDHHEEPIDLSKFDGFVKPFISRMAEKFHIDDDE